MAREKDRERNQPASPAADAETDYDGAELIDEQGVARRAYERYEQRGREHGHDQADWFAAEQELRDAHNR